MEIVDQAKLYCGSGNHDKVYRVVIEKQEHAPYQSPTYRVMAYWGRRTAPNSGQQEKIVTPSLTTAEAIMHTLIGAKIAKGYALLPAEPTPRKRHAPELSPIVESGEMVALDAAPHGKSDVPLVAGRRLRI